MLRVRRFSLKFDVMSLISALVSSWQVLFRGGDLSLRLIVSSEPLVMMLLRLSSTVFRLRRDMSERWLYELGLMRFETASR